MRRLVDVFCRSGGIFANFGTRHAGPRAGRESRMMRPVLAWMPDKPGMTGKPIAGTPATLRQGRGVGRAGRPPAALARVLRQRGQSRVAQKRGRSFDRPLHAAPLQMSGSTAAAASPLPARFRRPARPRAAPRSRAEGPPVRSPGRRCVSRPKARYLTGPTMAASFRAFRLIRRPIILREPLGHPPACPSSPRPCPSCEEPAPSSSGRLA